MSSPFSKATLPFPYLPLAPVESAVGAGHDVGEGEWGLGDGVPPVHSEVRLRGPPPLPKLQLPQHSLPPTPHPDASKSTVALIYVEYVAAEDRRQAKCCCHKVKCYCEKGAGCLRASCPLPAIFSTSSTSS